jgi:glycosyltransferase involved in cell wall biosynthesis
MTAAHRMSSTAPDVSIITPNFNGERFLVEFLNSVVYQESEQSVEIIIVDDGSTDSSTDLIAHYQQQHDGIRVLHRPHTGRPGKLRNIALSCARGRYALFVDSDDVLAPDAVQRLVPFADRHGADVVAFELTGIERTVPQSMLAATLPIADLVDSGIYKTLGIWKMCRTEFLTHHDIAFPEDLPRGDDAVFMAKALLCATRLSILANGPVYAVRGRHDGTSITQQPWPATERLAVARRLARIAVTYSRDQRSRDHMLVRVFHTEALAILEDPHTSDEHREATIQTLSPFWHPRLLPLMHTHHGRQRLEQLFTGAST